MDILWIKEQNILKLPSQENIQGDVRDNCEIDYS